ncbi:MAG: UV damage endonuclease UvsE [Candidatus Marinimicrobia bacterium]|jgi:UV DNA damage endonuclease|nr:UV damage endonuclease UvsE [Candidatus Neomarinimicrobiota bacterium]|tara:strand:+ start:2208 stop:3278 length:1071 start_codon:yes stop_codon:yes gene_type:complete
MTKRIGFACKYMHPDQTQKKKLLEEIQRPLNTRSTTVQWLNRQTVDVAEERLWDIMVHNIASYGRLIEYVGSLPEQLRMVRLGSDVLPVYTEPTWSYFWRKPDVVAYCEKHFATVGETARQRDVRLSMHPGQFTVLASDTEEIVERSIEEFEYHVDCIRWMGYGLQFQDFKCNVHISGRKGPAGIKAVLPRLSQEARNCITIENDENKWGIEASLELQKDVALVLDIHHHWVREAEYIQPSDDRFTRIIDSWRGVRPVIHYSYSRDEHLPADFAHDSMPSMNKLLEAGHKKAKLRAHSDYYPNQLVNDYALSFLDYADIMCESKCKNLASIELYKYYTGEKYDILEQDVRAYSAVA